MIDDATIADKIHACQIRIIQHEEELERIIRMIHTLKLTAEQEIEQAEQLYEECKRHDEFTVKAMQRRAENVRDLACKMHSMTIRF